MIDSDPVAPAKAPDEEAAEVEGVLSCCRGRKGEREEEGASEGWAGGGGRGREKEMERERFRESLSEREREKEG